MSKSPPAAAGAAADPQASASRDAAPSGERGRAGSAVVPDEAPGRPQPRFSDRPAREAGMAGPVPPVSAPAGAASPAPAVQGKGGAKAQGGGKGKGAGAARDSAPLQARAAEAPAPAGAGMAASPAVRVRPVAGRARMQRRHWGLIASFAGLVLAPLVAVAIYLFVFAVDQYGSTTGFTVRQEEGGGASDLLGGLAQITGGSSSPDGDILYEFIQSQEMVREIDAAVDLRTHYSQPFPDDPVFALWPGATIEDLQDYWERMVRILFDQSSGLVEVRVLAFDPETAQRIAAEIVRLSQDMINDLNAQSRDDAMRYARVDLEEALERLKSAREALTQFRTRNQIVDPETDIQSRMGVMANLQQQLAEALIEFDLLQQTTSEGDPRLRQARQRIEVIRGRIGEERDNFAPDTPEAVASGEDYPSLIAEYEGLTVDREFAEETYRAALTAVDLARAKVSRQSRYLATYIEPTRAERSEFPRRPILLGLAGLFLMLFWSILALVYYSIRDRG